MADESNFIPASRLVRWATLAVVVIAAIALYFRDGRKLSPFTAAAAATDTTR